jgi:thiol-disulfide isomerase/thioredoxin
MQARKTLPTLLALTILATACSTSGSTGSPVEMTDQPNATAIMEKSGDMIETATPEAMKASDTNIMGPAAWFSTTLTNVSDDRPFTIDGFKGKVVIVEMMAQWCTTCLRQEKEVKDMLNQLGMRNDLLMVGLDIDPNENASALKSYVAKNSFNWLFAVPPAEVSREIGNLYGTQFLNPPSAPILIVDRKGDTHILPFGVKSASDLLQNLEPFLNQGL